MSTPDEPAAPPLTRRQLREMRNTASTPVITPEQAAASPQAAAPVVAPLPRAAEPVAVPAAPPPAADVDLESHALTRRRARQQERLRTASVPVIEVAGPPIAAPVVEDLTGAAAEPDAEHEQRPVVAPAFGSRLLAGEAVELELPPSFDQLLSRGNGSSGAVGTSNALILSQTPETGALSSAVNSTGEVLITGTFNLPESFAATGMLHGSSDGKDIDAILVDGELPATSSPTPIAASAAISTIKSAEDVIRPPAPEKGSRLMLALVITAGALALALTGVLIVALATGAFQ